MRNCGSRGARSALRRAGSSARSMVVVAALLLLVVVVGSLPIAALAGSPDAAPAQAKEADARAEQAAVESTAGAPSPAAASPKEKNDKESTSAPSSDKQASVAAPVPIVREPSKWKATGPPFAGSAYSFFSADGKKQPILAYQEASKGAVGAGSTPGGATRLYRLENGGSWTAAAAPLPAPSTSAAADNVTSTDESAELKTIDSTKVVDYFLNGVAVSPQSGLVYVVFFPFATTDKAAEKAKAAVPLVYATTATGEDAGWSLVGAPTAGGDASSEAKGAAAPVGLGPAGPWRGAAVAADGDDVFVAYTSPSNGDGKSGPRGTLSVARATVKKSGKNETGSPSSSVLTTTPWSRVGSKPLETKTSPGRAFASAAGGHLVAGFENGDPFPGIAFERWSKKVGDKKFDEGKWERACGGSNANGTVPDSGNSQYDAPFLVAPDDGSIVVGTSPGTATNAVAAAAAALLTSSGFDELDKLGKLPNQVWICKGGPRGGGGGGGQWSAVFGGNNGSTAEGVEGRQSLTALALGPKDAVYAAYEAQAGPFVSKSADNKGSGAAKPKTVGGQGLGGRVLGRPVGLVVDANGVPTIALTNRGFGNTTGDSEDFREIVVKTCKAC